MVLLLDPYVDAILVLALAALIVGIMRSLTPFLAKLPYVGATLAGWVDAMAKAISKQCYQAFKTIDHALGVSFHAVAHFLGHSWGQLRSHAHAILESASVIGAIALVVHELHQLAHRLIAGHDAVSKAVKALEREYHGIEHRVKSLENKVARGIGHDLRIRIKALEREVTGIQDTVIPGLRAGVKTAEGEVAALNQWLGIKAGTKYKEWIIGLGVSILAALGLSGLNCDSNPFKNNKNACGLWGDLSALLGLATIAIEAANFEDLVREAQSLEEEAIGAVKTLWNL